MDHEVKLAWAHQHIDALQRDIDDFLDREPYEATLKYNDKQARYVATIHAREEPPLERWGLMVGDIVHNLRSALDSLAFAVWVSDMGRLPSEDEAKAIQFVITDNAAFWNSERKRRLSTMHPSVHAVFEKLQPYRRGHPKPRDLLAVLRDISNVDKHRRVSVVMAVANEAGITVSDGISPTQTISGWRGRLVRDTEIASFDVRDSSGALIPRENHPDMDVSGKLAFDIRFGDGFPGFGGNVVPVLRAMASHIEHNIFRWFAGLL